MWRFCEGWNPQALPYAIAYYAVSDVAGLVDRLLVLREVIAQRKAAEEGHGGG